MIDTLAFFNSVSSNKWIPLLWGKLKKICKERKEELNEINDIMFEKPMVLAKYYVEPDCQENNPADWDVEDEMDIREPVMVKINQFFKQPDLYYGSNQLFILSDAGMGKSALLCMIKLMHLTSFWPKSRDCVLKKLGIKTLDEISKEKIPNQRNTILLLDSLDEDPMTYGRVKDRLLEIIEATKFFAKVIITCRTQFFPPSEQNPLAKSGQFCFGPYRCYAKYLSFFNDEKVNQYLSKRLSQKWLRFWSDQQKVESAKKIINKMGSLRCRPMLLSYIEYLDNKAGKDEYHVYNALVCNWLLWELIKEEKLCVENLHDACLILAVWMQCLKKREISEKSLDKLIEKISEVRAIKLIDMRGRSLINRNSDGDYRFSHYSIQEFCVAKYISEKSCLKLKFKEEDKILVTDQVLKMIGESGKINPNFDLKFLDHSQISLSYKNKKKISKYGMEFVFIPLGLFKMGSPEEEEDRRGNEKLHMVLLTQGFYLQTTPVTQAQWETVMESNPSKFKGDRDRPVENVSWEEAQAFIERLNEREGGRMFALPTEAQWEYACRAGTETRFYTGDSKEDLDRVGWYNKNSDEKTHPVGQKEPNDFGLYDMHGNVWEWCQDWYGDYPNGSVIDPKGPSSGSHRVLRGGSWFYDGRDVRSAVRRRDAPTVRNGDLGLRLARGQQVIR